MRALLVYIYRCLRPEAVRTHTFLLLLYVWPREGLCRGPSQSQSEGQGGFRFLWRFISARHDTRQLFLQGHEPCSGVQGRVVVSSDLQTDTQTHQRGKVYRIRLFSARLAAPPRHRPLLPRPPPPRPLPRRSELSSTMRSAIADKDSHRHDVSLFADAFCTGTDAVLYPELITYPNPAFGRRFVRSFSQVCYVTS